MVEQDRPCGDYHWRNRCERLPNVKFYLSAGGIDTRADPGLGKNGCLHHYGDRPDTAGCALRGADCKAQALV